MEREDAARTSKPAAAVTSRGADPRRKNRNKLLMPGGHRNGGRPSKGDRHAVSTRIPVAEAEKLLREVDRQGITMSDYLASLIQRDLKDIDDPDSPRDDDHCPVPVIGSRGEKPGSSDPYPLPQHEKTPNAQFAPNSLLSEPGTMTTTKRHGGGMPSKGERQLVGSRIPIESVPKLRAAATARQISVSEFLADLIQHELDTVETEFMDVQRGTAYLLLPVPGPTRIPPMSQDRRPQEKRKSD